MGINLASLENWTRASAARTQRHNHHATKYSWFPNFTVCIIPLPNPGVQLHPFIRWGRGRHVLQIVRQLSMEADWQDAHLTLQDLAVSNLYLIYFTDFYIMQLLTRLFSFFSTLIFTPNCYLKLSQFSPQHYYELSRFFLCGNLYRFRDINVLDHTNFQIQMHHKTFLNEHVTYSFWWTL